MANETIKGGVGAGYDTTLRGYIDRQVSGFQLAVSSPGGANLVGYGAETVAQKLDQLARTATSSSGLSVLEAIALSHNVPLSEVTVLAPGAVKDVTHFYDSASQQLYYSEVKLSGSIGRFNLNTAEPYVTLSGKKHALIPAQWKQWRAQGDIRGWGAKCDYYRADGSVNPKPSDDTAAFVAAIAYLNRSSNRDRPHIIRVQGGAYIATPNLLFNTSEQSNARIRIIGDNYRNSELIYGVSASKKGEYMINCDDTSGDNVIFGFCSFENIGIRSANKNGYFMRMKTLGSSQLIKFIDCQFWPFGRLIDAEGITNGSEFEFRSCRIRDFMRPSTEYIFKMDNPQALNWLFYQTHIEVFDVPLFRLMGAGCISFVGGSIIPYTGGSIVQIPVGATNAHFGPGNRPSIQFQGARFEMRGQSMLIDKQHDPDSSVNCELLFYGCNMGGSNISPTSHTPIVLRGAGSLKFIDCANLQNYKMSYAATGLQRHKPEITFIRSDVSDSFITDSDVQISSNNVRNGPTIRIDNGNSLYPNGIFNFACAFVGYNQTTVYNAEFDNIASSRGGAVVTDEVAIVPSVLRKVSLHVGYLEGFGNIKMSLKVYNADKSKRLGSIEWSAIEDAGKVFEFDTYYAVGVGEKLIFEYANNSNHSDSIVQYTGILTLHH